MRLARHLTLTVCLTCITATYAFADATFFVGTTTTPTNRLAKGLAIGVGLVVVGFEFEFSDTAESVTDGSPSLRTGMGNVYLQTPIPIARLRPYFTTGGGGYRESLGTLQETHVGVNTGGGVKISLIGPLRARVDYRVFKLRGQPLYSTVHRLYVGANIGF
jgi:hypothetical protein